MNWGGGAVVTGRDVEGTNLTFRLAMYKSTSDGPVSLVQHLAVDMGVLVSKMEESSAAPCQASLTTISKVPGEEPYMRVC